jgi:hypothetical protein
MRTPDSHIGAGPIRLGGDAEIGTPERGPELGDEFLIGGL